jgi:hypothetical protein
MKGIFYLFITIVISLKAHAGGMTHVQLIQALVPDNEITHTAVQTGSWFDATTWQENQVPTTDARVLIPQNITVDYDAMSTTAIYGIKSRGILNFSTNQETLLRIDTLIIDTSGELIIGTINNPIQAKATIRFIDNGDIDVLKDPKLFGRGLLALGQVTMHGQEKTPHLKVAIDPVIGQNQITLSSHPTNWHIGDKLVLAGTKYSGWKWDNNISAVRYHGTQDEVITITAINNAIISFAESLQYNHLTPRVDLKTSVGNYSRNIRFETENASTVAREHRGHVMFVHHANVDVRYVEFNQLGRTSKDLDSFDADDVSPMLPDSNVRARYPFHFHRSGIDDPRHPAIAIGNAVFGSPGWGYVHHDSNAVLHNNVSFDTFGAGFIAETGNEIGVWTNNLAIKAEGNSAFNPKNGNFGVDFDTGRTGDGFWFQGRMVRANNNIAASVNHGYVYLHRGTGMINFPGSAFMLPEALSRFNLTAPDDAPILNFDANEAFASTVGLYVVKANPNQEHDIRSHLSNFLAWEVQAGAALEYTSHYLLQNFDIIGMTPEPFKEPMFGIEWGTNTSDMVANNVTIENMELGVRLDKFFTQATPPEVNQYVLIDVSFQNVTNNYEYYDATLDTIITNADLINNQFNVNLDASAFEYLDPATSFGVGVFYTGNLDDSVGNIPIPAGTDLWGTPNYDMISICEEDGYYRTSAGAPYVIAEEFFTDRATGRIHKYGLKTLLGPNVETELGAAFSPWVNAFQVGVIDLSSQAPIAQDDNATIGVNATATIDLLTNDSDPENDPLRVDGIVQPQHGMVYQNANNTVDYVADFDYIGSDSFYYWVTDNNGNYSVADVQINVTATAIENIFNNGFE